MLTHILTSTTKYELFQIFHSKEKKNASCYVFIFVKIKKRNTFFEALHVMHKIIKKFRVLAGALFFFILARITIVPDKYLVNQRSN